MCLKATDCEAMVSDCWNFELNLIGNLDNCRIGLINWDRHNFGSVSKKVRELRSELEDLQQKDFTAAVKIRVPDIKKELEI